MKKILKYFLLAFIILGVSSVIINLVNVNKEIKKPTENNEIELFHHFALVGTMNDWNVKDQTYLMKSKDDIEFTYTLEINEPIEFKIADNMSWSWQYGSDAVKSKGAYLSSSDGNIKITLPGKYDLNLNCETHELFIDINEVNLENYTESNNITLVGTMNGWYVDNIEHPFISNNDYTYTYTFVNTIGEVEFKLVNNASWDTCYGKEFVSTTAEWLDLTGDNIKIITYGEYTINFDYLRNDITISYDEIEPVDPIINVNIEDGAVLTLGVDNDPIVEITGGIGIVRYHSEFQDLDGNYVSNLLSSLTPGNYIYRIITEPDDYNNSVCLEVMVEVVEPYVNFLTDDIFVEDTNWSFNQVNFNSDNSSYTLSDVKSVIGQSLEEDSYYITGVNSDGGSIRAVMLYNDYLRFDYPLLNNIFLGVSYTFEEDITLNTLISFKSVNTPLKLYIDVKNSEGVSYLTSLEFYNFDENNTSFIYNYSFKSGDTITLIFNKDSGENVGYSYYFNYFCFVKTPEVLIIDDEEYVVEENPTSLANGYWQFANNINFNSGGALGINAKDSLGNYFQDIIVSGNELYGKLLSGEYLYFMGTDSTKEYLAINDDGSFKTNYYIKFFGEAWILDLLNQFGAKKYVSVNYENVNFDNYTIDENPSTITGGYWKFKTNFTSTSSSGYGVDMYDCFGNHFTSLDRAIDNKLVGSFGNGDNYVELTILYVGSEYIDGLATIDDSINENYYFYFSEESESMGLIQYLNSIATKYVLNE